MILSETESMIIHITLLDAKKTMIQIKLSESIKIEIILLKTELIIIKI